MEKILNRGKWEQISPNVLPTSLYFGALIPILLTPLYVGFWSLLTLFMVYYMPHCTDMVINLPFRIKVFE